MLDSNTWRINGTAPLEKVAASLSIKLPVEEYKLLQEWSGGYWEQYLKMGKHRK